MADDQDFIVRKPRRFARLRKVLKGFAILLLTLVVVAILALVVSTDRLRSFGGNPLRSRMDDSNHFDNGAFVNLEPTETMAPEDRWPSMKRWISGPEMRAPKCPLPIFADTGSRLVTPAASKLRITWLGHSTTLIEIDDVTVLTDPIWSERASPSSWVGPKRFHPPPLAIEELPRLDAVVISHEHYDHLDMESVRQLAERGVTFHVPFGIGAHLRTWNVQESQIVEHDWWEGADLPNGVRLFSTPARHFNGRGYPGRIGASWTSWSLVGPKHRVFFSGDTGMTESFREIAKRHGPFDIALLEIGQHDPSWGDIHLGPEGALDAQAMLQARTLIPIHWATFGLAFHAWSDPAEILVTQATARKASIATPLLGEPFEPALRTSTTTWWRAYPPTATECPD